MAFFYLPSNSVYVFFPIFITLSFIYCVSEHDIHSGSWENHAAYILHVALTVLQNCNPVDDSFSDYQIEKGAGFFTPLVRFPRLIKIALVLSFLW